MLRHSVNDNNQCRVTILLSLSRSNWLQSFIVDRFPCLILCWDLFGGWEVHPRGVCVKVSQSHYWFRQSTGCRSCRKLHSSEYFKSNVRVKCTQGRYTRGWSCSKGVFTNVHKYCYIKCRNVVNKTCVFKSN